MSASLPSYRYEAVRSDGTMEYGLIDAPSRDAARVAITGRGLFPVGVTIEDATSAERRRVPASDLALGLRILATLLAAGLPLDRVLAAFADLAPPRWAAALPSIRTKVHEGASLTSAFRDSMLDIPEVVLGMMAAGEAGSGLAQATERAARLAEREAATRRALWSALAYPFVLAATGLATLALMLGVVLPRFATILADLGQALPPLTRGVMVAANAARLLSLPLLIGLGLAAGAWYVWTATEEGRARWHGWLLQLPVIGGIRRSSGSARVCAALGSLLESGVSIAPALLSSARAAGDAALARRLIAAREDVVAGQRLSSAIEGQAALTSTAVRLIRAGEESGQLAAMLAHAATLEEQQASERVSTAVRFIEPSLILVFGIIVAVVAAALLQAVYSVRPLP